MGSSTEMKVSDSGAVVQLQHSLLDVDGTVKRSFQGLWQYLGTSEANYVIREVREGVCGNHSGANSLILKLVRAGYYWPWMEQDTKIFVQKCDKYQCHAQLVHQPVKRLHSVVKVDAYQKIGEREVVDFIWDHIVCRFEIPKEIACDNCNTVFTRIWFRGFETSLGEPALRFSRAEEETNNEALLVKLDLLKDHQDLAYVRMVAQKKTMERDLVMRKVTKFTRKVNAGKLGPTWEGPYPVSPVTGKGLGTA
nr:uncharacterized protein LOC117275141 [Nicotiana tomentosiformis]